MKVIVSCCSALLAAAALQGQTKSGAEAAEPVENTLGMKFVNVTGMPVRFSVWETRVRDYEAFATETRREWTRPDFEQTPDDPVVNVSWDDAAAFCQWLTARERAAGRLADRQRYRLPTDAEWSVAVGLGSERGRTPEDRLQASVVWPWGCTWPVGSFKPNASGIFDLGGNVWEWCDDWYNDARVTKPLRGGSFHDGQPKDLLAAYRFSGTVHLNNDDIGFRVVLQDDTLAEPAPHSSKNP